LKPLRTAAAVVLILATPFALAVAQTAKPRPKPAGTSATPAAPARRPAAKPAARAGAGRLDGIAAVVNDDVILESDVEEQLYLFIQQSRLRPDSATVDSIRSQVLDQLVDFRLVVAEAKRQGISLTANDQKMIAQQAEESLQQTKSRFPSEAEFQDALKKDNTTEAKLREKYRGDLTEQVMAQRLRDKTLPKHNITQADAEAYFKAHPDAFPLKPAEVKLQVIQIPPGADSAADQKAKAKVLEIKKRLASGERFAKVAAEVSEDENSARAGGDLGFLPKGALDAALDQAVATAKLNEVSGPVRSTAGWHLFEVMERDTAKTGAGRDSLDKDGKPLLEAHVRHILVRVPLTQDDIDRAKAIADKVHADAAKGGDFGALARKYSHYQGQAAPDGDLGYVPMTAFQNNIRAAIAAVPVGQVTDVLENPIGFNIFKVNDRRDERPYQLDEVKDQLIVAVGEIKDRESWDAWLKTLRGKAHVEIRKG
jgi:peptidyl-prolyl cis-trans isomerase SurA